MGAKPRLGLDQVHNDRALVVWPQDHPIQTVRRHCKPGSGLRLVTATAGRMDVGDRVLTSPSLPGSSFPGFSLAHDRISGVADGGMSPRFTAAAVRALPPELRFLQPFPAGSFCGIRFSRSPGWRFAAAA